MISFLVVIIGKILTSDRLNGVRAKTSLARSHQFLAVLTGTLGAVSDGMHYGWSSPLIPLLIAENSPIQGIHEGEVTTIETIYMVGGLVAIPIAVYAVDCIGRKYTILIGAIGSLIGWVLIAFARHIYMLYTARFICGLTGLMVFVSTPMYVAEIADHTIRGFLSGFYVISVLTGVLIVYSVGPFVKIATTSLVGSCFLVLQFLTFSFVPESPYFWMMKQRKEDCRKSLDFFRVGKNLDEEMETLEDVVKRQEHNRGKLLDLFKVKTNRLGLIILFVLNAAQHFSGISVMVMNVREILEVGHKTKYGLSSSHSGIVFSSFMLIGAITGLSLVDRFGRKTLYLISGMLTGFSAHSLATYFIIRDYGYDVDNYTWVPLIASVLYAVSFKIGLGTVPIVLTSEVFPTSVKALGVTLGHTSFTLFSVISIMSFHALTSIGSYVPFYIASICCLIAICFMIIFVPETKGKTLDEIQPLLKAQKLHWGFNNI